jgi:serine protease AprX
LIDEISVTTILGQQILVKKVNSLQAEVDLSLLSKGVYFVKVLAEGLEKKVKILKE